MRLVLASLVVLGCSPRVTPPAMPPADPQPADPQPPQPPPAPPPDAAPPEPVPPATPVSAADLESPARPKHTSHTSQAEIAVKLNDEGKRAVLAGELATASGKFREAVARVPEPVYSFNLCLSLYQEGKFGEALTACNAVEHNNPTPTVLDKTKRMMDRIRDEAKRQGIVVGS
jgi:hypothetical protein